MTGAITRILVPTDFSGPSDAALAYARTLAETFGASLHLLHVLDDPYAAAFAAELYAPPTEMREAWLKDAENRLATRMPPTDKARFRGTTNVTFGPTAKTIVEHAADEGVDLIVMGTHGRSGVAHLLIGSVAERVVRSAHCPVLTVREPWKRVEQPARVSDASTPVIA